MPDDVSAEYDATPRPTPEVEPHGAQSRPGFTAPHGTIIDRSELQRPIPDGVIGEIELIEAIRDRLREPTEDGRFRPALKRLRDLLPALAHSTDPAATDLLKRANAALPRQWRYQHSDTARLDSLLEYINRFDHPQPWTRDTVDRMMEGHTP
jgi:hypothetical protein